MEAAQAAQSSPRRDHLNRVLALLAEAGDLDCLLNQVGANWRQYDRATIEDALASSIESAYAHCGAEKPGAVFRWLKQDLRFRLLNAGRDEQEEERFQLRLAARQTLPEQVPGPEEEAAHGLNAVLAAALLSDFSSRDQNILRLAWGEGEGRAHIASVLAISESIVKHTLRRAGNRLQRKLCNHVGGGCGDNSEMLVRALAFQVPTAGAQDHAAAYDHMHRCGACLALYDKLEQVRVAVAALTPAPLAAKPSAVARASDRLAGVADWTRDQLASVYTRAHELAAAPPPVRPGAMLASLGVCAAAAGGSYCVNQVVPPLSALTQPGPERAEAPKQMPTPPKTAPPSPTVAPTPAPVTPTAKATPPAPTAKPTAPPAAPPKPPAPPPSQAAPSPATPQRDFDIEKGQPSTPRTPAAAPTQGGGEFF